MEYLVRLYNAPVNTLFYIWFLSIGLAAVATGFYFKLHFSRLPYRISKSTIGLSILAVSSLTILALNPYENRILAGVIAPLIAIVLAGIYMTLDWKEDISMKWISFGGWIFGAIYMLFIGALDSLLILSALFIAFSALPAFFIHFRKRREIENALKALNQN